MWLFKGILIGLLIGALYNEAAHETDTVSNAGTATDISLIEGWRQLRTRLSTTTEARVRGN